jgi:preprotein translocase subunit SecE
VVYRDGLENRYGLTAIGGSNPSPSAKLVIYTVNDYSKFGIGLAVVAVIFGFLWRMGHLVRITNYIHETREELRKCTWPTWDELKGSTLAVMVALILLGAFTVGVDFVILLVVNGLTHFNKAA